jgi:hypothetical protein
MAYQDKFVDGLIEEGSGVDVIDQFHQLSTQFLVN